MKESPVWHAIRTFPSMIREAANTPKQYIRQERDWKTLWSLFPGLEKFHDDQPTLMDMLALAYEEYINHVSSPLITLSRNRAAFLYFLCGLLKPTHILDLGSGFSSFVFRKYQKDHSLQQIVTTIDDAPYWLDRTAEFLQKHQLSTERMLSLRDFLSEEAPHYDLCFLDLGDLNARMHILPVLHERLLAHGSILLVDDLHVPAYRNHLENFCKRNKLQLYSLRKVTRRRLSHMGLIMKNPKQ